MDQHEFEAGRDRPPFLMEGRSRRRGERTAPVAPAGIAR
jgi:hypothetical protein